jgi:predicted  nucleic acid-binding Zn-ribbon protein
MDANFLAPLIPVVAIISFAAVKIARLRANRSELPSADVTARLEDLEHGIRSLHEELAETQERLDFAERLLTKAREERQIGPGDTKR